jgi:hypothetical protein
MKTTTTTKEEIQSKIMYCESVLRNNDLEVWEAREYNSLINDYKNEIAEIEENEAILATL